MTITTIPTIFDCPDDVLELISFYAGKDVVAWRSACQRFRDFSTRAFTVFTSRLFTHRYGARTPCEHDTPLHVLVKRIKSARALAIQLQIDLKKISSAHYLFALEKPPSRPSDLWLEIADDGVPQLVNYQKHFFENATSEVQLLQAKRELCRSSYKRDNKLDSVLTQQNKLAIELTYIPLDPKHSFQDLRNRCLRLQTLQLERNSLIYALQTSIDPLNQKEEKLSHYSILHVDRFLPLPTSYGVLNNLGAKLSEATYTYCDRKSHVEIMGRFQFSQDPIVPAQMEFCVMPKFRSSPIGSFMIEKVRCRKRNHQVLYIASFRDILSRDPTNGQRPIACLLIQLAVEIFQRESAKELEIVMPHSHSALMTEAGFIEIDHKESVSTFSIEKSNSCPLTQFISRDGNDQEEPALLAPGLTWEKQIENSPILYLAEGPILPPLLFL